MRTLRDQLTEGIFDDNVGDEDLIIELITPNPGEKSIDYRDRCNSIFMQYGYLRSVKYSARRKFVIVYITFSEVCIKMYDPRNRQSYSISRDRDSGKISCAFKSNLSPEYLKTSHHDARRIGVPVFYSSDPGDPICDAIKKYVDKNL